MTDAEISKLAFEHEEKAWGDCQAYEGFEAGLRKGLELNAAQLEAAWPSDKEIENYIAPGQADSLFIRAWVASSCWLKAQLLERLEVNNERI